MALYTADFQFETTNHTLYWLPLRIDADTPAIANEIFTRFHNGLAEKFNLCQALGPLPHESYSSELLRDYRREHRAGIPSVLNIVEYRFRPIANDPTLSFDDQLELLEIGPQDVLPVDDEIIAQCRNRKVIVRKIRNGEIEDLQELLVINVVMPTAFRTGED